ncbi:DUF192 domain-containing protein [Picosynechococcus sp. PCC 73109]|uniref:DUF192 domain-containing protein n=1 Tax=Picosynechococcus sp. PCC 73109 TaxID=374982 RepID=UPI000745880A|nr:DUF192 domain-containing protein [Picosynechococcus sp. PCC 73109]AMA08061.1 hypothetical protein AWQ23_01275 [Picosynechococcus sp. PCC 73109]
MSFTSRLCLALCGTVLVGCVPFPVDDSGLNSPPSETPVSQSAPRPQGQMLPITATAKIVGSEQRFGLEVAETAEQQRLGLMYREFLPDNRGMLFEFNPARPVSFWMKNCLINLDMIFLREGVVQAIAHDVPPCENDPCPTYGPPTTVNIDQVIEIRGGLAKEINLQAGDRIEVTKTNE